jgi:triosephosphate isomerase
MSNHVGKLTIQFEQTMRKPVIAGNWKMHKLIRQAVATALEIKQLVSGINHCEIVIAPPFTALKSVADRLEGSNVKVCAQDISTELGYGAHTGEICGDMLTDAGCGYVIVGHSERRTFYAETDSSINEKIRAALSCNLTPVVCVGESLGERDAGQAEEVVAAQIKGAFVGFSAQDIASVIIAYEPVWAIGTGRTATPQQAQAMHHYIRQVIGQNFTAEVAVSIRILYGGSVKPDNISALMQEEDIDGALVGGASLDAASFYQIVSQSRSL